MKSRLNKSFSSSGLETAGHLEGVVDPPLETGESTNHNDSCSETVPETLETDFAVDFFNLLASWCVGFSLVEDRNHGVSRVRDDGAEDTSPVTRQEGNHELGVLRVGVLGGGEDVLVESLDGVFESGELNHGVWNLSHPQRCDTLIETIDTFVGLDLSESLEEVSCEGSVVSSLHSDFNLY